MFTVFTQVVNTVDPSISNEEIESFIQKLKDSKLVEDVAFGDNMKVSYVPMTFREDGSWLCDGRIDIYAPNYGK